MNGIHGVNMTNFFNRELFLYSLGDIRFKKPVSLKKAAYFLVTLLIYTLPLFLFFGIPDNPIKAVLMFAPPFLVGHYSTKPAFAGKNLIDFLKTMINFLKEPKGWTDLNANNEIDREVFFVEHEIWISRRRELQLLADIKEQRERTQKEKKQRKWKLTPRRD